MGSYLDSSDALLIALTRQRRAEAQARGACVRYSVRAAPEVIVCSPEKAKRREAAAKRWRQRQWAAGNRSCAYCTGRLVVQGKRTPFNHPMLATTDHRHPLAKNGADRASNWAMCCWACNQRKGNKTEAEFRALLARELAQAA